MAIRIKPPRSAAPSSQTCFHHEIFRGIRLTPLRLPKGADAPTVPLYRCAELEAQLQCPPGALAEALVSPEVLAAGLRAEHLLLTGPQVIDALDLTCQVALDLIKEGEPDVPPRVRRRMERCARRLRDKVRASAKPTVLH